MKKMKGIRCAVFLLLLALSFFAGRCSMASDGESLEEALCRTVRGELFHAESDLYMLTRRWEGAYLAGAREHMGQVARTLEMCGEYQLPRLYDRETEEAADAQAYELVCRYLIAVSEYLNTLPDDAAELGAGRDEVRDHLTYIQRTLDVGGGRSADFAEIYRWITDDAIVRGLAFWQPAEQTAAAP